MGRDIPLGAIDPGLSLQQPQHRVREVIVADRRIKLRGHAAGPQARLLSVRQPHHHRHLFLLMRSKGVGQGIQVEVVFAQ